MPQVNIALDNREIATLITIAGIVFGALCYPVFRDALLSIFGILLRRVIVKFVLIAAAWSTIWIYALASVGVWTIQNLKTTILWFLGITASTLFNTNDLHSGRIDLRKTIKDAAGATALIAFIANAYVFSLTTELILMPIVTFCALFSGTRSTDAGHQAVSKFFERVLIAIGAFCFFYTIYRASLDVGSFINWKNGREFAIPVILTILYVPLIYVLTIYIAYEFGNVRLGIPIRHRLLRLYALRKAFPALGPDLESLRYWITYLQQHRPRNRRDIDNSIELWERRRIHRYDPPQPLAGTGWPIELASQMMADEGLIFEEYSPTAPREWGAGIQSVELIPGNDASRVWAYIQGTETVVTSLTMAFWMHYGDNFSYEETKATAIYRLFVLRALGDFPMELNVGIRGREEFELDIMDRRVTYTRESHDYGYNASIVIAMPDNSQPLVLSP